MVGEDNIADRGEAESNEHSKRSPKDFYMEFFKSRSTTRNSRGHRKITNHTGICTLCDTEKLIVSQNSYSNFYTHVVNQHHDIFEADNSFTEEEDEVFNSEDIMVEGEEDAQADEDEEESTNKRRFWTAEFDNHLLRMTIEEKVFMQSPVQKSRIWQTIATMLQDLTNVEHCPARACRRRVERLLYHHKNGHSQINQRLDVKANLDRSLLLAELNKIVEESQVNVAEEGEESAVRSSTRVNKIHRFKPYSTDKQSLASTRTRRTHASDQSPLLPYTIPVGSNGLGYEYTTSFSEANPETELYDVLADRSNADGKTSCSRNLLSDNGLPSTTAYNDEDRSWAKELLESRKADDLRRREEIALRREELQLQRSKLEFERLQWETEKKERETRLALEEQERKIMFDFMRKTLNLNGPQS